MSKIIVRRQEYANNGTHANEIEAVVQQNLIANTLSSATDIAASVGLVKSETDAIKESLTYKSGEQYSIRYSRIPVAVNSGHTVAEATLFFPKKINTTPTISYPTSTISLRIDGTNYANVTVDRIYADRISDTMLNLVFSITGGLDTNADLKVGFFMQASTMTFTF